MRRGKSSKCGNGTSRAAQTPTKTTSASIPSTPPSIHKNRQVATDAVLNNKMTLTQASKHYNVPLTTLSYYVQSARKKLYGPNYNKEKMKRQKKVTKFDIDGPVVNGAKNGVNGADGRKRKFNNQQVTRTLNGPKRLKTTEQQPANGTQKRVREENGNGNGHAELFSADFVFTKSKNANKAKYLPLYDTFEKTFYIYGLLSVRQKYHPVFLQRNLSYMRQKNNSSNGKNGASHKKKPLRPREMTRRLEGLCDRLRKQKEDAQDYELGKRAAPKVNKELQISFKGFRVHDLESLLGLSAKNGLNKRHKIDTNQYKVFVELFAINHEKGLILDKTLFLLGKCEIPLLTSIDAFSVPSRSSDTIKICMNGQSANENFFLYFNVSLVKASSENIIDEFSTIFNVKTNKSESVLKEAFTSYSLSLQQRNGPKVPNEAQSPSRSGITASSLIKAFQSSPIIEFSVEITDVTSWKLTENGNSYSKMSSNGKGSHSNPVSNGNNNNNNHKGVIEITSSPLSESSISSISSPSLTSSFESPSSSPLNEETRSVASNAILINGVSGKRLRNSYQKYIERAKIRNYANGFAKDKRHPMTKFTHSQNLKVFYQFFCRDDFKVMVSLENLIKNGSSRKAPFHCPICFVNCREFGILQKHFTFNHFRLQIEAIPNQISASTNRIQINVKINELFDGSYLGNQYDLYSPFGYSLSRRKPTKRVSLTYIFVSKKSNFEFSNDINDLYGANHMQQNCLYHTSGLEKLYYHTRTCSPIKPDELMNNLKDSDDEIDPEWLREQTAQFLQEFTDVNAGEKEIMRLWNVHVMKKNYIADLQIVQACEEFIDETTQHLVDNCLCKNFLLHLANLHDYGLMDEVKLFKLCCMFNDRVDAIEASKIKSEKF